MKITDSIINGKHVVKIVGTIDTTTSDYLNEYLQGLDFKNEDIVIDFNEVNYITSAGLRVLLILRKNYAKNDISLVGVNTDILSVLKSTGFDGYFTIEIKNDEVFDFKNENFVTLLKRRVLNYKDHVAYVFNDRNYTWEDIDMGSQMVAYELSKQGVGKNSHVGICSVNSINWVFTFFAIQKLGAIAVLVNFSLKPEEIYTALKIADVTHLCYAELKGTMLSDSLKEIVFKNNAQLSMINISFDIDFTANKEEYERIKNAYIDLRNADDPSIMIFTSGSTGIPKAVLNSSYNVITAIKEMPKITERDRENRNLSFLPFFHIFGFSSTIVLNLLINYTCYIPSSSKAEILLDMIEKYQLTSFDTVNTILLRMVQLDNFSPEKVKTLQTCIVGGSVTTESQLILLKKSFPNCTFFNIYGMSEKSIISITRKNDPFEKSTTTVGLPFDGVEIIFKDPEGHILKQGQQGEIYVRSKAMIICYYKLDILNQPIDENGFFATGDLGYLDKDGYLVLTGRAKDLIIRGGENIAPSEVSNVLAELDFVADVKVLGVPDKELGEEVGAALVLKPGVEFEEEKVRNYLAEHLARYKIPRYFVIYDKFPVLGSGKVDSITLKKDFLTKIQK